MFPLCFGIGLKSKAGRYCLGDGSGTIISGLTL